VLSADAGLFVQLWFDSVFNLKYSGSVLLVSIFTHHRNARVGFGFGFVPPKSQFRF